MPKHGLFIFLCLQLSFALYAENENPGSSDTKKGVPDKANMAKLVEQLGHEQFSIRNAARKRLLELGPEAIRHLREAVRSHEEPEIQNSARRLLAQLEVGSPRVLILATNGAPHLEGKFEITRPHCREKVIQNQKDWKSFVKRCDEAVAKMLRAKKIDFDKEQLIAIWAFPVHYVPEKGSWVTKIAVEEKRWVIHYAIKQSGTKVLGPMRPLLVLKMPRTTKTIEFVKEVDDN